MRRTREAKGPGSYAPTCVGASDRWSGCALRPRVAALLLCVVSLLGSASTQAQGDPEVFVIEQDLERAKEADADRRGGPVRVEELRPRPELVQPIPTAPAAPEGWCCLRGQSFASSAPACVERGGRFFDLRRDADRACAAQPPPPPPPGVQPVEPRPPEPRPHEPPMEGWCCHRGEVFPAPEPACRERGGLFLPDRERAEHECRARHDEPPRDEPFGACCLRGELLEAPARECREAGGAFFADPELARRECGPRGEPPQGEPFGFCCLRGDLIEAPARDCREAGGAFFVDPELARRECRPRGEPEAPGWCCREGEVFPAPDFECRELGGRFFPDPEAAEHACRRGPAPGIAPPTWQIPKGQPDPMRPDAFPPGRVERACPAGCQCLLPSHATQLGLHALCEERPCGHDAAADEPKFCFGAKPPTPCSGDVDCDGVPDAKDNCPQHANPGQEDSEGAWIKTPQGWIPGATGKGTKKGDGVGDVCDNCPKVMNANQWDSDNDGVGNDCDNCLSQANADQKDSDGDEVGDACDTCSGADDRQDADGDGVADACDNCPSQKNKDQKNTDGDAEGDACDRCPTIHNALDGDKDGVPDCDDQCPGKNDKIDKDKDAVPDCRDNCLGVANPATTFDNATGLSVQDDVDGDGLGDACDCDDGIQGPNEAGCDCGGSCPTLCSYCKEKKLPARFDYRDWKCQSWITSVKNQAQCGSCWAFAAVGAAEAKGVIESKPKGGLDLSEQFLVSNEGPGDDCEGGSHEWALEEIRDEGLPLESCFPYQSQSCLDKAGDCKSGCEWSYSLWTQCSKPKAYQGLQVTAPCANVLSSGGYKITDFSDVDSDVDDYKRALVCKGPLSVCTSEWGHCIVVVGWDDGFAKSGYKGAWIIKNSWGSNWTSSKPGTAIKKGSTGLWTAGPGFAHIPYKGHPYSDIIDNGLSIDGIDGSSAHAK